MAYYSTHSFSQFLLNNEKQRVRFLLAHPVLLNVKSCVYKVFQEHVKSLLWMLPKSVTFGFSDFTQGSSIRYSCQLKQMWMLAWYTETMGYNTIASAAAHNKNVTVSVFYYLDGL